MMASQEEITLVLPPCNPNSQAFRTIFQYVLKYRGVDMANKFVPSKGLFQIKTHYHTSASVEEYNNNIVRNIELNSELEDNLRRLISNIRVSKCMDSFSKFGMCDGGSFLIEIENCDSSLSISLEAGNEYGCHVEGLDDFLKEIYRLSEMPS